MGQRQDVKDGKNCSRNKLNLTLKFTAPQLLVVLALGSFLF